MDNGLTNATFFNRRSKQWSFTGLHTPHRWHLRLRRRSNSQRNFHRKERQMPWKVGIPYHICQLIAASVCQKRCASVDLSHLSPPQLVSVGIVLPGTRNRPIIHRAHGWHRSRRCICPNGSFHDHRTWHHTWCHSLVQLRETQRSRVSTDYPFISIHFHWHYSDIWFSENCSQCSDFCSHGTGKCHPVNQRNESRWRSQSQTAKDVEFSKSLAMDFCIQKWSNTCNSLWNPEDAVKHVYTVHIFIFCCRSFNGCENLCDIQLHTYVGSPLSPLAWLSVLHCSSCNQRHSGNGCWIFKSCLHRTSHSTFASRKTYSNLCIQNS